MLTRRGLFLYPRAVNSVLSGVFNVALETDANHYFTTLMSNVGQNDAQVSVRARASGGAWRVLGSWTIKSRVSRVISFYCCTDEVEYQFTGISNENNVAGVGATLKVDFVEFYGSVGGL